MSVAVLLSVKCLQFVFLASLFVVVGKGKVPTAGLSQGYCTNTFFFCILVFYLQSVEAMLARRKSFFFGVQNQ